MGTIRTKPTKDIFGNGNEKEVIIGNEKYTIRTKPTKDIFGDGNELEIERHSHVEFKDSMASLLNKWCVFAIILIFISPFLALKRDIAETTSIWPGLCFILSIVLYVISCIKDYKSYQGMWTLKVVIVMIIFLFVFDLFIMFLLFIGDCDTMFPISKFFINFIKWIFIG